MEYEFFVFRFIFPELFLGQILYCNYLFIISSPQLPSVLLLAGNVIQLIFTVKNKNKNHNKNM